jgi:hypothetical protein
MGTFGLPAVPWAFLDSELMKVWVWRTDHFEVRVNADVNSFSWEILDLMASSEGRFLTEGRARDFAGAENEVREAIGKCYPPKYGYGRYAGSLATTFTLATGERLDFGLFAGTRAVIVVRLPDGREQPFVGSVRVNHYEIWLTPDTGSTVRIQPAHIVRVTGEGGGAAAAAKTAYTGVGRLYRGALVRGCNGKPGFMPDTVDHIGDACTIHEDAATRIH